MRFNLKRLLLVFPAIFLGILLADDIGAQRDVLGWRRVRNELALLQERLQEIAAEHPKEELSAEKINRWIDDSPPIDDDAVMWTTFKLRPAKDPWGHFYRCNELPAEAGLARFGFYSSGSDGETTSRGNDADDLNTWDDSKYQLYKERENRSQRTGNALVGLCFAPFIYLGLLAIWPLTKFLLADIGWWKAKEAA